MGSEIAHHGVWFSGFRGECASAALKAGRVRPSSSPNPARPSNHHACNQQLLSCVQKVAPFEECLWSFVSIYFSNLQNASADKAS